MAADELARLTRRLERERRARREAEAIAERTTSALYDRKRELEMLGAVATAANDATTLEDALAVAVEGICTYLQWPFGHAWLVREGGDRLVSARVAHVADPAYDDLLELSKGITFERGVGLPGRVWATGRPSCIEDVAQDENFPRKAVSPVPLGAAFASPILIGAECVGVIEMVSPRPGPIDEGIVTLVAQIGTQLGRVVERLRAQEEMRYQALHDALTGLPNRVLFLDRLSSALARAARRGTLTGVLFVDLDHFKSINDTAGHQVGDDLLRQVGVRLDGEMRGEDTLARLGGDEFVVLCEDLGDERDALDLGERLQRRLLRPFDLDGHEQLMTASIGIAIATPGSTEALALLRDADSAMYKAKDNGRGRYELFSEDMRDRILQRLRVERRLDTAIDHDELRLHYQPIVSLDNRRVEGVEALVRWEDPEHGTRSPAEFIPVAEQSPLILRLGEWVLRTACAQAAAWRDTPGCESLLPVHVNLAARQLSDPDLPALVEEALATASLESDGLVLEITETALIENAETSARSLARLRALGVAVSLDDFGTGYSSLSYLRRFPLDVLKIDRAFVTDLADDPSAGTIVQAIVGMGHALGLRVVAEGIESADQARAAQLLECDSGQGYLFARPGPPDALTRALGSAGASPSRV